MPDANRTNAQWTAFFNRFLHALRKERALTEMLERFQSSATVIVEHGDTTPNTVASTWALSGVNIGTNTSAEGLIYVRVTGTGPYTIKGYTAASASGEVFTGSGAAGASVTITESNSSGISGSVTLEASPSADTSDNHRLRCLVGFPKMDIQVFNGDDASDGELIRAHQDFNRQAIASLTSLRDAAARILRTAAFAEWISDFIKAGGSQGFLNLTTEVDDDQVSLAVTGVLDDLREAMEDESNTTQQIAVNTLSAGSASFDAGNTGSGTLSVGSILPAMTAGTLIIKCTNETPPERFQVTFRPDDVFDPPVTGENDLVVGKAWNDSRIPVSMTLSRTYDKNSTDGSNLEVAAASSASVTGISLTNSDDGVLYGEISANGSNWDIEFYKASGRTSGDLVALATNVATGAAFTATQQNRSGLTVSWTVGSGPTDTNTFQLDCNLFKVGPPADVLSVAITSYATGAIQEAVRERLNWYLNQGGSVTIADSLLERGGIFNKEVI